MTSGLRCRFAGHSQLLRGLLASNSSPAKETPNEQMSLYIYIYILYKAQTPVSHADILGMSAASGGDHSSLPG